MRSSQNYDPTAGSSNNREQAEQPTGQTVQTPWSTANQALLRQYLDQVFYPAIFPDIITPTEPNQFTGFTVDMSDLIDTESLIPGLNGSVDDEDGFVTYTPVQRVLMLHRQFVVFCGHRQSEWWKEYIAELIHFFGECGEPPVSAQEALRAPLVMQTLRHFC